MNMLDPTNILKVNSPPNLAPSPEKIRLLVIDDDDVDREKIKRLLSNNAKVAEIVEADSAQSAMQLLRSQVFDCVLIDYHLGDACGVDLLPTIRESTGDHPCPVITITGYGDERSAVHAMREGVYDYLSKGNLTQKILWTVIDASQTWARLQRDLVVAQQRLERLSLYDELTGLPNRTLFFDRLEQAVNNSDRGGSPLALLMMDLNLFKEINDTLGHQAGDQVLAEVGRRLSILGRQADSFARLGGDEFSGLLLGVASPEGAVRVAEKIIHSINQPMVVEGQLIRISVSIGIAMRGPDECDARALMNKADQAMYEAKRGAVGFAVYQDASIVAGRKPLLIISQLCDGIERGELVLHYQPKISLENGQLLGVEALVRWNSPTLGFLEPADFIPAAERCAAIAPLTYSVLNMALDQMAIWRQAKVDMPIAVNLSARMLEDPHLVARVTQSLTDRHLPPQLLTLEVTETALVGHPERARTALRKLSDNGIAIAIDDFGAGYTSLNYLREFNFSEIKIDKAFVTQLKSGSRDASIVRSVALLSRGFGVELVAEGSEDRSGWNMLRELGCDAAQGYSIGHPMPPELVNGWHQHWRNSGSFSRQ